MSDGYLTPKKTPLQWAASRLSDGAFKAFITLFSHVNDIGTCYPGFKLLAEMTRHELPCIWIEMQEVMALDLVRQLKAPQRDEFGRWSTAVYQVNPDFIYIRPDKLAEATGKWNSVEQTIEQKVPANFLPSKVSIESTAESALAINSRESTPENQQQQSAFSSNAEEGSKSNTNAKTQSAANNSAVRRTKTPPVPASPPKYAPLTPIPVALTGDDETLALCIRDRAKVPIKLSRSLIVKFGYARVHTALNSDFVRDAFKPGGALRSMLEQQQIESDEPLSSSRADGIIR